MIPHPYQEKGLNEILEKFNRVNKVVYQLGTGGGKTAVFSFLCQRWIPEHETNILILCHRTELVTQSEETLNNIGIGSETITAGVKHIKNHSRVYIGMIETVNNRYKKNPYFLKNIGLVIVDECHILTFNKIFKHFLTAKFLGCTATPTVMKRETFWKCPFCKNTFDEETNCCDNETQEWSRPYTLSRIYDDIVVGPSIKEIIEFGSIVEDVSFIKHYTDDNTLKTDSDGEFTTESIDNAYNTDTAAFNVILNYKELCEGKKTIIFNGSTKNNLIIYQKFIDAGYTNVKMFDSVNKEQSGHRGELLKWFDETPDAILLNVGTFTTGFDSREVQAIILNRPTASLSLFLQIVGRGGRSSKKIFKDNFIVIDGGGNIDRFGEWSSDRDWKDIFFNGSSKERCKTNNPMDIQDCPQCGCLYPKTDPECPECGSVIERSPKPQSHEKESEDVLQPIRRIPPPNPERIYQYTVSRNEDLNFAWRILISYIVDMFKMYQVTRDTYEKTLANGKFEKRILALIRPSYFKLKGKPDLDSGVQRTQKYFVQKIKSQLDKRYYA